MSKRGPKPRPLAERLWAKVDRSAGPDGCWPWTGHRIRSGHGQMNVGNHVLGYAHRVAFEVSVGRPAVGHVLHKPLVCHNPACCNPAHLYEGDDAQNTRDRQTDGTMPKGETHWNQKLKESDIPVIRALRHWSGFKLREIAAEYRVTEGAITQIMRGKTWRHVESGA